MRNDTPQRQLRLACRQYRRAHHNLRNALQVLKVKHYPPDNAIGVRQALVDNQASIQYLDDLAREFAHIAPPIEGPTPNPLLADFP